MYCLQLEKEKKQKKVKRVNLTSHKFPYWLEIMNRNGTGGDK